MAKRLNISNDYSSGNCAEFHRLPEIIIAMSGSNIEMFFLYFYYFNLGGEGVFM